jgi:tetratricopeptide (TPR) repeat protein
MVNPEHRALEHEIRITKALGTLFYGAMLTAAFYLSACVTPKGFEGERRNERFERSENFFAEGKYEEAFKENQMVISERGKEADTALFNMGVISAHSQNPKKDYPKAVSYFRQVVNDYPQSPKAEPAKAWIEILEEHQRILEEKQKLGEEKRTLTREKETLAREKELLSQERGKLKQMAEKSRQVDIEIEKRRRQARSK